MKQLLLWVVVLFAAWRGYAHFADPPAQVSSAPVAAQAGELAPRSPPVQSSGSFQCDGRIHCSQMVSRAEAEFFVRHCPGTRMDGDNDGEPCESDSRF